MMQLMLLAGAHRRWLLRRSKQTRQLFRELEFPRLLQARRKLPHFGKSELPREPACTLQRTFMMFS